MSELPIKHSEQINEVFGALAKAKLNYKTVVRTHENTYTNSKYADLQDLIDATQQALATEGLVIMQFPIENLNEQKAGAFTYLGHASGQYMSVEFMLPATAKASGGALKFDAQSVGAAVTYAKRQTYQGLAGVVGETEDDGDSIADKSSDTATPAKPKQVRAPEVNRAAAQSNQSARPNTPTPSKPAAQTNDHAPAVDSGVPKAIIPPEASVAQSQPETLFDAGGPPNVHSAAQNPPDQGVSSQPTGPVPNKTQFDGFTARAMALKQPLEKAGLKPSKNLTTGAKLKAFLLSTTGAKELTDLNITQWEKFLTETEEAVKVDASAVVAKIEGGA